MRTLIGLWLALFVASLGVSAANAETTASRVFAADSPSVVVVTAVDSSGHVIAQGSGVVISRGVVVSNCHVFENRDTKTASVNYRGKSMSATLRYADVDHDLCSFLVAGIDAPAVTMRGADALKVGEDAYAIGAPEGYDLTLSAGIVSSLRKIPGGTVIQTTAPISPGSSGGGLFDSEGRLIGITSYYAKEGQQINFALPVEWVKSLPQSGKTLQQLASQQPESEGNYQDGVKAALAADYTAAFAIFSPLAESGDAKAQAELGWMYGQGNGVPQDYAEAAYWDRKAALQGDFVAQNNLAVLYGSGLGVGRDLAKAVYWYRKAASQGFAPAQYVVGVAYYSGQGVPQDYAQALYWYAEAAKQGNSDAQSYLGAMYAKGEGVPADYATSAYWRLKAADQGNTVSQAALGALYFAGVGVPQDFVQSAKWWILAQAGGEKSAVTLLPLAEKKMTAAQIAEAQRLAREWWTAHHVQ